MLKRAQRALAVLTLLLVAFTLHALICDWRIKAQVTRTSGIRPLMTWSHEQPWVQTGLFSRRDGTPAVIPTSRVGAVVSGVACPLFLVGLSGYLVLGWMHEARTRRGFCGKCGYDLRSHSGGRCPECGERS